MSERVEIPGASPAQLLPSQFSTLFHRSWDSLEGQEHQNWNSPVPPLPGSEPQTAVNLGVLLPERNVKLSEAIGNRVLEEFPVLSILDYRCFEAFSLSLTKAQLVSDKLVCNGSQKKPTCLNEKHERERTLCFSME